MQCILEIDIYLYSVLVYLTALSFRLLQERGTSLIIHRADTRIQISTSEHKETYLMCRVAGFSLNFVSTQSSFFPVAPHCVSVLVVCFKELT